MDTSVVIGVLVLFVILELIIIIVVLAATSQSLRDGRVLLAQAQMSVNKAGATIRQQRLVIAALQKQCDRLNGE